MVRIGPGKAEIVSPQLIRQNAYSESAPRYRQERVIIIKLLDWWRGARDAGKMARFPRGRARAIQTIRINASDAAAGALDPRNHQRPADAPV